MKRMILAAILAAPAISPAFLGCGGDAGPADTAYLAPPVLQSAHAVGIGGEHLKPVQLMFQNDTLSVAYAGVARLDLFNPDLVKIGEIPLTEPEPVFPTDFIIADSEVYVCDHARGIIAAYDMGGRLRQSYGSLPDQKTSLSPFAVTYLGGVLYVGDARLHRVLAISMTDTPGITERGELILTIPADTARTAGFPSALLVTPDGRLLIGDAAGGNIAAYTCDGRYIYSFDGVGTQTPMAPQGLAIDDIPDPAMRDSTSFDPSGLRYIGRIHAVDANTGRIHMFNPVGRYLASYPETALAKPSDIAIDTGGRRVYVAEPSTGRILIFRYGE